METEIQQPSVRRFFLYIQDLGYVFTVVWTSGERLQVPGTFIVLTLVRCYCNINFLDMNFNLHEYLRYCGTTEPLISIP